MRISIYSENNKQNIVEEEIREFIDFLQTLEGSFTSLEDVLEEIGNYLEENKQTLFKTEENNFILSNIENQPESSDGIKDPNKSKLPLKNQKKEAKSQKTNNLEEFKLESKPSDFEQLFLKNINLIKFLLSVPYLK